MSTSTVETKGFFLIAGYADTGAETVPPVPDFFGVWDSVVGKVETKVGMCRRLSSAAKSIFFWRGSLPAYACQYLFSTSPVGTKGFFPYGQCWESTTGAVPPDPVFLDAGRSVVG